MAWGADRVLLVTLTIRHARGDDLAENLRAVALAYSRVLAGSQWGRIKRRYGIVHSVRAVETTHGAHGWHPHAHVLLFCDRRLSDAELGALSEDERQASEEDLARLALDGLEGELSERWGRRVGALLGPGAVPSRARGVHVARCHAGEYLSKMGLEVSDPGGKVARVSSSRSPWEILSDAVTHRRKRDAALWAEYVHATKGRRALTWSKGAAAALGVRDEDEGAELPDEDEGEAFLIPGKVWDEACRNDSEAPSTILQEAETAGGCAAVRLAFHLARRERPLVSEVLRFPALAPRGRPK